jgi:hypothetical protein
MEVETTKPTTEREMLRAAAKYFAPGDELVSRLQFVADHHDAFEVERLCEIVAVERSSFNAWKAAAPTRAARAEADARAHRPDPCGPHRGPNHRGPADHRPGSTTPATVKPQVSGSIASGWPG